MVNYDSNVAINICAYVQSCWTCVCIETDWSHLKTAHKNVSSIEGQFSYLASKSLWNVSIYDDKYKRNW